MAFSHFVPKGKTLFVAAGGFTYVGPCTATRNTGTTTLPKFYTDGTPTAVQPSGPEKVVVDKMALSEEDSERPAPPPSAVQKSKNRRKSSS